MEAVGNEDDASEDRQWGPGRRTALVVIVAMIGASVFVALRLAANGGDPTAFVRVGIDRIDLDAPRSVDFDLDDSTGYDGQYFYRQAIDPLSTDELVQGIPFDRPAYRSGRILYPTLAWAASGGGRTDLVPWALIAVNVAAVGAIAGAGATLARSSGRNEVWGLLFASWPGYIVTLGFDLAEPVEMALVLWALVAGRRRHNVAMALLLSLAAITREGSLLVSLALAAAAVLRLVPSVARRVGALAERRPPLAAIALPPATYLAMQWWMDRRFRDDVPAAVSKSADLVSNVPGVELVRQLTTWISDAGLVDLVQLLQVLAMLVLFGALLASLVDLRSGEAWERILLGGATLAFLMLSAYDRMVIYLRWPNLLVMVGLVVFLGSDADRRPEWVTERLVVGTIGGLALTTLPIWVVI